MTRRLSALFYVGSHISPLVLSTNLSLSPSFSLSLSLYLFSLSLPLSLCTLVVALMLIMPSLSIYLSLSSWPNLSHTLSPSPLSLSFLTAILFQMCQELDHARIIVKKIIGAERMESYVSHIEKIGIQQNGVDIDRLIHTCRTISIMGSLVRIFLLFYSPSLSLTSLFLSPLISLYFSLFLSISLSFATSLFHLPSISLSISLFPPLLLHYTSDCLTNTNASLPSTTPLTNHRIGNTWTVFLTWALSSSVHWMTPRATKLLSTTSLSLHLLRTLRKCLKLFHLILQSSNGLR